MFFSERASGLKGSVSRILDIPSTQNCPEDFTGWKPQPLPAPVIEDSSANLLPRL